MNDSLRVFFNNYSVSTWLEASCHNNKRASLYIVARKGLCLVSYSLFLLCLVSIQAVVEAFWSERNPDEEDGSEKVDTDDGDASSYEDDDDDDGLESRARKEVGRVSDEDEEGETDEVDPVRDTEDDISSDEDATDAINAITKFNSSKQNLY